MANTLAWVFASLLIVVAGSSAADSEGPLAFAYVHDDAQLIDSPEAALAALAKQPGIAPAGNRDPLRIALGLKTHPVWIKLLLPKDTRVLTVTNSWVFSFDLYLLNGDQIVKHYPSGTGEPAASRQVQDPRFAYRISSTTQQPAVLIKHTQPSSLVVYSTEFFTAAEYADNVLRLHLRNGFYYGLVFIVFLFTIALWFLNRSRTHLYFVTYTVGLVLIVSTLNGFAAVYLLPNSPVLMPALIQASGAIGLSSYLMFSIHLSRLWEIAPRFTIFCRGIAALVLVNALSVVFLRSNSGVIFELLATIVCGLLHIGLSVYLVRRKQTVGWILLVSRLPVIAASFGLILISFWPEGPVSIAYESLFIGACCELIMLSIAQAHWLRRDQQSRDAAIQKADVLGQQLQQLQAITDEATQLRNVQRSVQDAHRLRSISHLASGIAHDFNNIFTSIMGYSELLKTPSVQVSAERQHGYAKQINDASQRGAELVEQLLIYSRSTKPEIRNFELTTSVAATTDFVRRGLPLGIKLEVALPEHPIQVQLDENQVRQVLINLIVNAIEASPDQGTVSVELGLATVQPHRCSACLNNFSGSRIVLSVLDEGAGVAEPVQDLFTPFVTSKHIGTGSGLGLSVVDGIVHEHGGHLTLANRSRGGARVDVCLPANSESRHQLDQPARLLYVKADANAATTALSKLERYYQVATAERVSEALAQFLDNHRHFELIVIEVTPPHDTWVEIAGDIRSANPATPILFLTNDPEAQQALAALNRTQKPSNTLVLNIASEQDSLLSKVEQLLNPEEVQSHNVQSLRMALRRMQNQTE